MTIEQIETFLAVVENRGFRPASRRLFLTQPSVSVRIHNLEQELDVSLFIRSGRSVALSEQGKTLLPYAETILHLYKELLAEMKKNTCHHT